MGEAPVWQEIMINIGLKRPQTVALWTLAQSAMISQSEFIQILNESGASGLLALCQKKGILNLSKPAHSEMNFEHMLYQQYHTHNALFFTYSHAIRPVVDIKNWRLNVEGNGVANPLSLSYDELLKVPCTTVTRYLECAGNGRSFFESLLKKKTDGLQWRFGGWGIAEWTGVRLSELLKMAKIKKEAVEVMPVGLDTPPGERPIPISKAMEEDTILAYIMNGEILPPDHGFPLRALLPGWVGVSNVKWVNKIVVSTQPIQVATNTKRYVLIGPDYMPQPPALGSIITDQVVKSACCLPWPATLKAGHQKIIGYAWSPFGKIAKVEVSLDGGKTFFQAGLTGPNIERAGTRWEFHFHAEPGELTITPRATDEKGNTQPEISQQKWNQLGYLFGAMVPHPVIVPESGGESYSGEKGDSGTISSSGCC